ncbi:MAG: cyclodeaminase/cyclohydrolase family protein [Anaerovoracaceae bacterium]|jgi:formiminotetrahydrofolate cyclodeaminase
MLEKTCIEFIESLASKEPVPGGGGASALVASLGIALGSMVGNLTTGKKKYVDVEEDIQRLLNESKVLSQTLNSLVLKDAEAFEPLSKAYGLPKETEEERLYKEKILQEALINATLAPMEIAECALKCIKILDEYSKIGSRLVISDAGVGVSFCKAALQGAKLSVLINLKMMTNQKLKEEYGRRIQEIEEEGLQLADKVYKYVEELICC